MMQHDKDITPQELLEYMNDTPLLLSLLYDLSLMPEELIARGLSKGTREWWEMEIITIHWMMNEKTIKGGSGETERADPA